MNPYKGHCYYERCWLPENNKKYLWQALLVFLSVIVLCAATESFTFLGLFLVASPIMMDVINTELRVRALNGVRIAFVIFNGILLFCCFLGFIQILTDTGDYFAISETFMFWPGLKIKKTVVALVVMMDAIVPLAFWIGAPCQKALCMMEATAVVLEGKDG